MGWFSDDSDQAQAYNQYQNADKSGSEPHKAKLSHELIAAAASYEAAKAYEDHVKENGKPDSHAKAKEIFAGFTGAFLDREIETHGRNLVDRETAKYEAHKHAEKYLQDEYSDN